MNYDIYIGIDNGINGGISIIENDIIKVFRIPVIKKIVNKKEKKTYDLTKLVDIFKPFCGKKVLFAIESISIRPGEGGVSACTIGAGFGKLIGIAAAFNFNIEEIHPLTWKKHFPELKSSEIVEFKKQIKELKEKAKTIKEKGAKEENKRLIEKLGREVKSNAKAGARLLAAKLYPYLDGEFKQINSDGKAESVLIAKYAQDNYDKLVQET